MRIRFRATHGFCTADEDAIACGVSGPDADAVDHALWFSRASEAADPDDDDGVYAEFDDQINGAFNRVGRCRLGRTALAVDLSGPLGRHLIGVEGFDVDLAIDEDSYEVLRSGLIRVFRAMPGVLDLA